MKKRRKTNKGITLVALVITVIILLILAGIVISSLTGDNGLFKRAKYARIETALGTIKEQLMLEQNEKAIDNIKLTPETLLAEGKVERTVQEAEDKNYYMYYALKEDAVEGMQGLGKGNLANLKDVFIIDDDLNVKYIASDGKEYGDNVENKILEDETEIKFSSKSFSEYVSKISGVTEDELKFKWMKKQTSLTIADSSVDSLQDLVFFPNLESLTLGESGNKNIPQIISMDGVENCTKLTKLTLYYGPDKEYSAVSKLSNLTYFYRLSGNDYDNIIDNIKSCKNLESLYIKSQHNINMSRISELNNLKSLDLSGNGITEISGIDKMTNLEELNLGTNLITKIEGLNRLINLKRLYLNDNNIEDITPLNANMSLVYLNLKDNDRIDGNRNNYTGERLQALNKIGEILDRDGQINLDINKLGLFTNYKRLDLSNQNLSTLDALEGLTELTYLRLENNQITLEDEKSQEILKSMNKLTELNFKKNKLTDITSINNLENLTKLTLSDNNVNLAEIEDIISNLSFLRVSTESLKTIVNCDVNKITKIRLNTSSLTEIPDLSKFTNLIELDLSSNPDIVNLSDISKITSLQILKLNNTNLHGRMIDFSNLTNLQYIELQNNYLSSDDLNKLSVLKNNTKLTLDLRKNSIIDASSLIVFQPTTIIRLSENVNLSSESKEALTERFGNNVSF